MNHKSINNKNYNNFLIKEKKSILPVEPDLLFDFYLSPALFIIEDIAKKCDHYIDNSMIILDAAIEVKNKKLKHNYKLVYFKTFNSIKSHLYLSENNEIFISHDFEEYLSNLLKHSPNPIEFRWI